MQAPNRSISILLLLSMLTLIQAAVFGQSQANTGNIEGSVVDPSGRGVPSAEVTITNTGTNFVRVVQTDGEGRFRGLLLPLGPYKVVAKAASFGSTAREGLDLAVGQTITLSLALSLSQLDQVISVTALAPFSRPAAWNRPRIWTSVRFATCRTTGVISSAWCR